VKSRSTLIARRLVPHFNVLWGVKRNREGQLLSPHARAVLKVLRVEWEMATADLRGASGVRDRAKFTRAIDELQNAMKAIPGDDRGRHVQVRHVRLGRRGSEARGRDVDQSSQRGGTG